MHSLFAISRMVGYKLGVVSIILPPQVAPRDGLVQIFLVSDQIFRTPCGLSGHTKNLVWGRDYHSVCYISYYNFVSSQLKYSVHAVYVDTYLVLSCPDRRTGYYIEC